MSPELRTKLLAIPGMPTDEDGNPPTGFTELSRHATNVFEFALNDDGKAVQHLVLALDGHDMNKPETCGRMFIYEAEGGGE